MIYGYVRVSCDKQTTENQIFEIKRFAKCHTISINHWINETISGTIDIHNRKLGKLLKTLNKGDIIISTELSRFGRNLLQVMSVLAYCMENSITVWTIKDNYRLGADLQSKIMAFAFSLSAEIERNLISQRTKEALVRIKAEGRALGRPVGTKNRKHILDNKEKKILYDLSRQIPVAQIARSLRVSPRTVHRYIDSNIKKKDRYFVLK